MNSRRRCCLALMFVVACSKERAEQPRAEPAARAAPASSASRENAAVPLSAHHLGPMPLDSSLSWLASRFPGSRCDTTVQAEAPGPSCTFEVSGISATAFFYGLSDSSQAPVAWMIAGRGILLDDSVPMPRDWAAFRARFAGPGALAIDELGAHAELCELPGLTFFLDFNYDADDMDTLTLASVPQTASVVDIGVFGGGSRNPAVCARQDAVGRP